MIETVDADMTGLVNEYRSLLHSVRSMRDAQGAVNSDALAEVLRSKADWTQRGAEHIAALVRENGTFVLRNALAIAIALEVEDGSLGL